MVTARNPYKFEYQVGNKIVRTGRNRNLEERERRLKLWDIETKRLERVKKFKEGKLKCYSGKFCPFVSL